MASKAMMYAIVFGELYGDERRYAYEASIQPGFAMINEGIVDLRYRIKRNEMTHQDRACEVDTLEARISEFNITLYQFASCFDRRQQIATGCIGGAVQVLPATPTCKSASPARKADDQQ
jgi:hypothetical protein